MPHWIVPLAAHGAHSFAVELARQLSDDERTEATLGTGLVRREANPVVTDAEGRYVRIVTEQAHFDFARASIGEGMLERIGHELAHQYPQCGGIA